MISQKLMQLDAEEGWLKYATKGEMGHSFLPHEPKKLAILEEIQDGAQAEFPNHTPGQIADAITTIVNE